MRARSTKPAVLAPAPGYVNEVYVQWQDGGKRIIVWPKEMATGKFILPPWSTDPQTQR